MRENLSACILDFEVDFLAWLAGEAHAEITDLALGTFYDVLEIANCVFDVHTDRAHVAGVLDLSNELILAILDKGNGHFGTVEAGTRALERSFHCQEKRFI